MSTRVLHSWNLKLDDESTLLQTWGESSEVVNLEMWTGVLCSWKGKERKTDSLEVQRERGGDAVFV